MINVHRAGCGCVNCNKPMPIPAWPGAEVNEARLQHYKDWRSGHRLDNPNVTRDQIEENS